MRVSEKQALYRRDTDCKWKTSEIFKDNVFANRRIELEIAVIIYISFAARRVELSILRARIPIAPCVGIKKLR